MTQNSTNLNLKNENKLIQESCMLENRASLTNDSLQLTAYGLQEDGLRLAAYCLQDNSKSKIQNPKSIIF